MFAGLLVLFSGGESDHGTLRRKGVSLGRFIANIDGRLKTILQGNLSPLFIQIWVLNLLLFLLNSYTF